MVEHFQEMEFADMSPLMVLAFPLRSPLIFTSPLMVFTLATYHVTSILCAWSQSRESIFPLTWMEIFFSSPGVRSIPSMVTFPLLIDMEDPLKAIPLIVKVDMG